MDKKRPYRKQVRAAGEAETRLRIVEATMQLHEEVGPRETSISAIAARAGVQRLTVYRHFPDETAVFQACTSHWLTLNPPPDPATWQSGADARQRLDAAVRAFHAYYRGTQAMWRKAYRDVADVPALREPMAEFESYLAGVAQDLAVTFAGGEAGRLCRAAILHVLHFSSWAELEAQGLTDDEKLTLAHRWVTSCA